jgi:hypothetical protein
MRRARVALTFPMLQGGREGVGGGVRNMLLWQPAVPACLPASLDSPAAVAAVAAKITGLVNAAGKEEKDEENLRSNPKHHSLRNARCEKQYNSLLAVRRFCSGFRTPRRFHKTYETPCTAVVDVHSGVVLMIGTYFKDGIDFFYTKLVGFVEATQFRPI